MKPNVLTIAGSDPTGGAGIQADLRTFDYFGVHGLSAVTAVTAQNSTGVKACWPVTPCAVSDQISTLSEDFVFGAIKIGMLANVSILSSVISVVRRIVEVSPCEVPLILDPVLLSSSGYPLLEPSAVSLMKDELFPLVTYLTPNLPEARTLIPSHSQSSSDPHDLCRMLTDLGVKNVILKGGHGSGDISEDILYDGKEFMTFASRRLKNVEVHGSGCLLSSALAANLALGRNPKDAMDASKNYINEIFYRASLSYSDGITLLL